jgi:flagellar hook-associated protein 1
MTSMLSTGVSGLVALQTALDTTSHNISNSSTTGYSRQTVSLSTNTADYSNGYWIGSGVSVTSVQRVYNDIVSSQVRNAASGKGQWDIYSSLGEQIDNMLGDSSSGISAAVQNLTNAFQTVANSPTSTSSRQVLLSQANALVSQLQSYDSQLASLNGQVNSQLKGEATTISGLASSIAALNAKIASSYGNNGNAPNDLLDQRDKLIDDLSTHINVSTVKQADGQVNVFIGNGQALVMDGNAATMSIGTDSFDASRTTVLLQTGSIQSDVTNSLSGGTVGGLLNFRSDVLDTARNTLGQIALGIADVVNQQQNDGMDLNGSLGADMFTVGGVQVQNNNNNTGTGSLAVTRTDVSALTTSDYIMTRTSTGWSLQRTDTGANVAMTGSGTAASPFVADGMSIVVSGSAATGDKFMIRPTSNAVSGMSVAITDPREVAAAAPITTSTSASNTGSASITQGEVVDSSNANLLNTVTIQFLSASTYTTDGGATTNTYTSGQAITLNGWKVTLSGTPATGDTFTVQANTNGAGDNRNALLLANAMDKKMLSSGSESVNTTISNWISSVGVQTQQAQSNLTTQSTVYDDALSSQQSISGVNLDEEAANLIRYQQAYAAAAKVISTANTLFDSLLAAIR